MSWQKISTVERIARYRLDEDYPPKTVSLCVVDSLADIPALIQTSNAHFVLFLALDGSGVETESIYSTAELLLDRGMVYVCVWGPDCERVHDAIDQPRFRRIPE